MSVYLWSTNSTDLQSLIADLETLFKSTDGKFKLHIRQKSTKKLLSSVIIKDEQLSLKIKPGLTQFAALDKNTLLLRFQLDGSQINLSRLTKSV